MSKTTSDLKRKTLILHVLSWILTFLPVLIWVPMALSKSTEATRNVLICSITICIILCGLNVIFKHHIRSVVWILMLGIYVCLKDIQALLIVIAIFTILDEFFVTPLYKHYKERYHINREIDKRIES